MLCIKKHKFLFSKCKIPIFDNFRWKKCKIHYEEGVKATKTTVAFRASKKRLLMSRDSKCLLAILGCCYTNYRGASFNLTLSKLVSSPFKHVLHVCTSNKLRTKKIFMDCFVKSKQCNEYQIFICLINFRGQINQVQYVS